MPWPQKPYYVLDVSKNWYRAVMLTGEQWITKNSEKIQWQELGLGLRLEMSGMLRSDFLNNTLEDMISFP